MPIPDTANLGDSGHIQDHNDISAVLTDYESRLVILEGGGPGSGVDADFLDGNDSSYYAPINSPTFTGVPAAPTPSPGTNTTQLATTAYVQSEISLAQELPSPVGETDKYLKSDGTNAVWSFIPEEIPDQTGNSGKYLTTDGSLVSWSTINLSVETTTDITTTSATTIFTLDGTVNRSAEFIIQVTQGTKYTTSKVVMVHNGSAPTIVEYAVVEIGTPVIPLTISATGSGTDMLLQATVTDADVTNAHVVVRADEVIIYNG